MTRESTPFTIAAIDLFCGAGGLTFGLQSEGIPVRAGFDSDPACQYAYETNNPASKFTKADVAQLKGASLSRYFGDASLRILAGCAPCQPFSLYTQGKAPHKDERWGLLGEFNRLVKEVRPEVVTMENVPRLVQEKVFKTFVRSLRSMKYKVNWQEVDCTAYGIPQKRRRLVLLAGLGKHINLLPPSSATKSCTVAQAIGHLPSLGAGELHDSDHLHRTQGLSARNLTRIRASRPGGSWREWEADLQADCHQKKSGRSYGSVYGRMEWDKPSPTITTQFYGFGNGRFGHPEQDRGLSLREGAILQTFPDDYVFHSPGTVPHFVTTGRLIGNAVPVALARVIAQSILSAYGFEKS